MSHVTTLKMKVHEEYLDCLEAALPQGMDLRRGQKTHAWWGRFVGDSQVPDGYRPEQYGHCEHAIGYTGETPRNGPAGPWEIGLYRAPDGDGYELLADTYGGAGRRITAPLAGIRQRYAANVAERRALETLSRHGWRAAGRETLPNGALRVTLRKR